MQHKNNSILSKENAIFIFACSIYLLIFFGFGFPKGEFLDGLTYSSIARNLSLNHQWFQLQYSATHYSTFHEQPPLFFWLQSLFFYVLGDHFWVEYLMNMFILLALILLFIRLLKLVAHTNNSEIGIYLLSLLTAPILIWSFKNNMIENIVILFTSLSIFYQWKAQNQEHKWLLLFLAGFFIGLAVLSKGLIGLSPLSVTPFYYLIYQKKKVTILFGEMLIIFSGLLAPIICLMFISDFRAYILEYWDVQVISSLAGKREVMNRWSLLVNLFFEQGLLIFFIMISVTVYFFTKIEITKENRKHSIFFLLIALSASLPLLISPKQHSYYIVPSIPFFTLCFFFLSRDLLKQILTQEITFKLARILSFFFIVLSIIVGFFKFGEIRKNKDKTEVAFYLKDHQITKECIKIEEQKDNLWIWVGTLQRYGKNSVSITNEASEYLVSDKQLANQDELLFKNEKYFIYKINP